MTHEELRETYELFVFGTLEDPERSELASHLARGCPECAAGIARARALATHLAMTAPEVDPPAHLRSHTMRAVVQATPRQLSFWEGIFWRMAFPVSAIAVVSLLLVTFGLFREIHALNQERDTLTKTSAQLKERQKATMARLNAYREAMALVTSKDAREIHFGPKQPQGSVFVHSKGLLMVATNLPLPPAGRTYELWLLRKNEPAPVPAGVFDPDSTGGALHMLRRDIDLASLKAVALSDEPPGGSASPTGKVFLVVPMSR